MRLRLDRLVSNQQNTLSILFLDDEFFGFVPEDAWHETKISGETRIPCGIYDVKWTDSPRFKRFTYEIMSVPYFSGIRFQVGNSAKDTEGCVMPGRGVDIVGGKYTTATSGSAMVEFEARLRKAEAEGETIQIKISDEILERADLY